MRKHFEILDGLRGTAALLVVIFHLLESNIPDCALNPLHHAYIAVDFFFLLSGFVVGYAYDHRWKTMTTLEFFKIRLIRLHPLVLLGVTIGALGYWFDPFVGDAQQVSFTTMLVTFLFGILIIPFYALPNRYDETHSLNGPCWTLLQEYFGNVLYALIGPRIKQTGLIILVLISGIVLLVADTLHGPLLGGWGWSNFWMAPVRMIFPFFMGLLVYRSGFRIKIPYAWVVLSIVMLVIFMIPYFGQYTGLYEALCIIFVFPLIVAAGAGSDISGKWQSLCNFCGKISYPIYITHYPFIYIYAHWIWTSGESPTPTESLLVGTGLFVVFISLAWFAMKFYDEPVRAWLAARTSKKNAA